MIRPSSLNAAAICHGSAYLAETGLCTRTEYSGFGQAWAALVEQRDDWASEFSRLTADDQRRIYEAWSWYTAEAPLPDGARHSVRISLDVDGIPCEEDPCTEGTLDHCWSDCGTAWVRDDKTGQRDVPHPSRNLQTAAYVTWWRAETMADRAGVEIVNPVKRTIERHVFAAGELAAMGSDRDLYLELCGLIG